MFPLCSYFKLFIALKILVISQIQFGSTELSASPLTKLNTITRCHEKTTSLTLECFSGHKIRVLDSFYGVAVESTSKLYCNETFTDFSLSNEGGALDCKSYTNFQNACNGKASCSVNFFQIFLNECNANSNYLTVFYECVPDSRIHSVCSNVETTSLWGTLQTKNFPLPHSSYEDCWCKLVAENNQRIVLSVISFQLFPLDLNCTDAGLYLQSDRLRNKECTILHQDHYYISSNRNLYLNFYSKRSSLNGGFWIIYEASDGRSKISLKCGETDGVRPSEFTQFLPSTETSFPLLSTSQNIKPIDVDSLKTSSSFNEDAASVTNSEEIILNYENSMSSVKSKEEEINENDINKMVNDIYLSSNSNKFLYNLNESFINWLNTTKSTSTPITTFLTKIATKTSSKKPRTSTKKNVTISTSRTSPIPSSTLPVRLIVNFHNNSSIENRLNNLFPSKNNQTNDFEKMNYSNMFIEMINRRFFTNPITKRKSTVHPTSISILNKTKNQSVIQPTTPTITTGTRSMRTKTSTAKKLKMPTTAETTKNSTAAIITKTTTILNEILILTSKKKAFYWVLTDKSLQKVEKPLNENHFFTILFNTTKTLTSTKTAYYVSNKTKMNYEKLFSVFLQSKKHNKTTFTNKNLSLETASPELPANVTSTMIDSNNRTEYMSSVRGNDEKSIFLTESSSNSAKIASKDKKLSKTELVIITSCVSFIALLTLLNLFIYVVKRSKKTDGKIDQINANDPENKKPYDILPGVGEIVLWAANDKRGYLIDTNGSWAKIDSQRWIRENVNALQNTYKKASMAYRNKFRKKSFQKENNNLIKKLPMKTKTTEYENNTSSSSSSLNDPIKFIETDYHIEHGHINAAYLPEKNKLFQASLNTSPYKLNYLCQYNSGNEPFMDNRKKNDQSLEESNIREYNHIAYQANPASTLSKNQLNYIESLTHSSQTQTIKAKSYETSITDITSSSSELDTDSTAVTKRPFFKRDNENMSKQEIFYSGNQPIEVYNGQIYLKQSDLEYYKETEGKKSVNSVESTEILSDKELMKNGNSSAYKSATLEKNKSTVIKKESSKNRQILIQKSNTSIENKNNRQLKEIPTISLRSINFKNELGPKTLEQKLKNPDLIQQRYDYYQAKLYNLQDLPVTETAKNNLYNRAINLKSMNNIYTNSQDPTEQTSFVYQPISNALLKGQYGDFSRNENFSDLMLNKNVEVNNVTLSFNNINENKSTAMQLTQNIKSRYGSNNFKRNSSVTKTANDSGFLDEQKEEKENLIKKTSFSSFSPLSKTSLAHQQLKSSKMRLKKLKSSQAANMHKSNDFDFLDDSGIDTAVTLAKNLSTSTPSLYSNGANKETASVAGTTIIFDNDESNLMANKEIAWSAEDLNLLKSSHSPSGSSSSKRMRRIKKNPSTSDAFMRRKDNCNSSTSLFAPITKKQPDMSSSFGSIVNRIHQEETNEDILIQSLVNKLKDSQNTSSEKHMSTDDLARLSSLSNQEVYRLLLEISNKENNIKQQQQIEQEILSNSESSLDRSPTISSSASSIQQYQMVSIDKEEDTPVIMKNLHSVKSLKKFFEIKANNKNSTNSNSILGQTQKLATTSAAAATISISKEQNFLSNKFIQSSTSSGTSTSGTITLLQDIFIKNSESSSSDVSAAATKVEVKIVDLDSNSPISQDMIPIAPPLPDFFSANQFKQQTSDFKSIRKRDDQAENSSDCVTITNTTSLNFNQNIVSQCKQFKLHEKLIREIHNKTLERSARKDMHLSIDKHGNLINHSNQVYKVANARQRASGRRKAVRAFDRDMARMIKNNLNNDENDNVSEFVSISQLPSAVPTLDRHQMNQSSFVEAKKQQDLNGSLPPVGSNNSTNGMTIQNAMNNCEHRQRATSFRSDFSVRSTGSGCSARSMLSEARAKLEAYSGSRMMKISCESKTSS